MKRQKTGGRQAGTPNKMNSELRQWITNFVNDNREQIDSDWKTLEPKERIVLFEKLLKYTLPSLQAIQLQTGRQTQLVVDFTEL